jgi:hypothetical protein
VNQPLPLLTLTLRLIPHPSQLLLTATPLRHHVGVLVPAVQAHAAMGEVGTGVPTVVDRPLPASPLKHPRLVIVYLFTKKTSVETLVRLLLLVMFSACLV